MFGHIGGVFIPGHDGQMHALLVQRLQDVGARGEHVLENPRRLLECLVRDLGGTENGEAAHGQMFLVEGIQVPGLPQGLGHGPDFPVLRQDLRHRESQSAGGAAAIACSTFPSSRKSVSIVPRTCDSNIPGSHTECNVASLDSPGGISSAAAAGSSLRGSEVPEIVRELRISDETSLQFCR